MTCKDCIYFKRCVVLGVELDIEHNKNADKNCRYFKNKADFAEVVHGEWIAEYYGSDDIICSVCGDMWNVIDNCTETFKNCPNCGAKMDGIPRERS